jgi:hypothetical protein
MLLPLHGTCEPRPKYGRLPGPAAQKTISCPRDQAQGHREGKSIKSLPFNLNVAGGRAKFAAARLSLSPRPGPRLRLPGKDYHDTVYNLRCMTERNASSERIWYGRRSLAGWHSDRGGSISSLFCIMILIKRTFQMFAARE